MQSWSGQLDEDDDGHDDDDDDDDDDGYVLNCSLRRKILIPIVDGWSIAFLNSIVSRLTNSLIYCDNDDH